MVETRYVVVEGFRSPWLMPWSVFYLECQK
jgi:hypothetical protein